MKAVPLLSLLAAGAAFGQTPVTNPHTSAADRAAGAAIFRSHCAPCHGVGGKGGLGPNLTTGVFFHGSSDAELYRNIGNGIEGTAMAGVFFDGTQVWQIVTFVRSINQQATTEPVRGNAAHGAQLFQEKGCIGCHLVRGEGGVKGPDLSVIGSQRSPEHFRESMLDPNAKVSPDFWVAKIITRDGTSYSGFVMNQDTYMVQILDFSRGLLSIKRSDFEDYGIDRSSAMPSYKDRLSESEIDDLISYLASLKRPQRTSE